MLSTRDDIKEAYRGDKTSGGYVTERFASELNRILHERQVDAINAVIRSIKPRRVLDIAPGPGRLTRDLDLVGMTVCLEYNEGMIEHGRMACNGKATWIRGDGFHLPFAPAFDLIYCFRFIRHFHHEDRKRLYAEIKRVLRPGGYFIVDAVNDSISRPLREAHPENYPIYDKLFRREELYAELTNAGFEPTELLPVQKHYDWQYRSQIFLGPRANWLNRLVIKALERSWCRDGLEWIATCRQK